MFPYFADSLIDDPRDPKEREAEADRQQQWDAFVTYLRAYVKPCFGWSAIIAAVPITMDHTPEYDLCDIERELENFAETFGWPDTLRAIAQALQADERLRKELVDRR